MSPIFLFMPRFRGDAWMLQPQRLGVLVKYGEGPHMSALALIPIALASPGWRSRSGGRGPSRSPAVFSAGVVANNFYGATALAIFYPMLVWAFWITRQDKRILAARLRHPGARVRTLRVLAGALLLQGHRREHEVRLRARHHVVHLGGSAGGRRLRRHHRQARARQRGLTWDVFVAGCVVFFSLNVLGNLTSISASPASPRACCRNWT